MKRKLITLLLVLSMVFGLVACGGSNGSDDTVGNAGSTEEIPEKPDYTVTVSAAVTITGDAFTTLQKAAEDFNASQTDYKIDLYYGGGYGDILTVIQTSSPNDIPDLYMTSGNGSGLILNQEQYYVPVQKFIDEDNYDTSDIVKFFGSNFKKNGEWVAVPWGSSNVGQFWNKDLLAKVGLKVEDMDSYEDILAACDKLAAAGYKDFYGMTQFTHNDWFNCALASEGINYMDENNGRDGVPSTYLYEDNKKCKQAALDYFTFVREMIDRGYTSDIKLTASDLQNGFAKGDYVAIDSYCSRTSTILGLVNGAFEVAYQPGPTVHADVKTKGQAPAGSCFIIGKSGNYWTERGAWEFIKYLLGNADINAQYAIDTGYTPSTYSATNSDTYQAYVNNVFPDVKRLLDAQNATPENIGYALSPVQSEAQSHFVTIVNNMYYDSSYTAEKAMKDFSDQCNESLELYRITQGLE